MRATVQDIMRVIWSRNLQLRVTAFDWDKPSQLSTSRKSYKNISPRNEVPEVVPFERQALNGTAERNYTGRAHPPGGHP